MLPRNVRLSLLLVQLVAIATLMRSIAFDRWITVLASAILLVGAAAAHRNRAWGVALMFAQAMAFPVAFMIGIAPAWFCLVGALGMIPFLHAAPGFAKIDRGATRVLAALAVAGGAIGAIGWKLLAPSVFESFPSLAPGIYPNHGIVVAAVAALGVAIAVRNRRLVDEDASEAAHVRVAQPARIAALEDAAVVARADAEDELTEEEVLPHRARR